MDHVFLISVSDLVSNVLDFLGFIWGWLVTGGIARILVWILQIVLGVYIKRSLDNDEPHKLLIHAQHFLQDHDGLMPSKCEEGLCKGISIGYHNN
jgi:hypothetical protein